MRDRVPAVIAGVYAVLGALSFVPVLTGDDPLSGIFVVLLGLPWTKLLSSALAAIAPGASVGPVAGGALGLAGIAVNTAILYFASRWVVRRRGGP
jgi:hypothetical protein